MQSINLEKEKRSEKSTLITRSNISKSLVPINVDNDEVSQVYGERKLEISIQDGQSYFTMSEVPDWKESEEWERQYFFYRRQELSPD